MVWFTVIWQSGCNSLMSAYTPGMSQSAAGRAQAPSNQISQIGPLLVSNSRNCRFM